MRAAAGLMKSIRGMNPGYASGVLADPGPQKEGCEQEDWKESNQRTHRKDNDIRFSIARQGKTTYGGQNVFGRVFDGTKMRSCTKSQATPRACWNLSRDFCARK